METYNKEKQTLHEQLADSELYDEENKDNKDTLKVILEKQAKVEQVLQEAEWLLVNEEMETLQ